MNESNLLYEPAPAVSKEFRKEFNSRVPLSPNGVDRLIRFVWGCDRKDTVAGEHICRYGDIEFPPKYVGRVGWILEGWNSPEVYDRKEWEACGSLLGEYPVNGVFDFLAYLEDEEQGFVPLEDGRAMKMVESWAWWQGQGKKRSITHLMEQKALRLQLQRAREQEASDAVAQRFGEQVVQCFEQAKDTPDAYSLPSNFTRSDAGIIIPKGLAANTKGA